MKDPGFEEKVAQRVRRFQFEAIEEVKGTVTVKFPFVFEPTSG